MTYSHSFEVIVLKPDLHINSYNEFRRVYFIAFFASFAEMCSLYQEREYLFSEAHDPVASVRPNFRRFPFFPVATSFGVGLEQFTLRNS